MIIYLIKCSEGNLYLSRSLNINFLSVGTTVVSAQIILLKKYSNPIWIDESRLESLL